MSSMTNDYDLLRHKMVDEQLLTRNVKSAVVLEAMRNVPRHLFVQENMLGHAYADVPLPIGLGQTISQPYIVAYMTEQLAPVPGMKVLEIGTGSGYQTAILAYIGCEVYTIELLKELADKAKKAFSALAYDAIKTKLGSGFDGWPEEAPFDAIIVTAAPDAVPEVLISQLKVGGKMIVPVGKTGATQALKRITKTDNGIAEDYLLSVRFVPMVR